MNKNRALVSNLIATNKAYRRTMNHQAVSDENWAVWWADYLLNQTDFQSQSRRHWEVPELAQALNDLKSAYLQTTQRRPWPRYYAERLAE